MGDSDAKALASLVWLSMINCGGLSIEIVGGICGMKKTGKIWDTSILNILARQELKRARQTNLASIRAAVSAPSVVDIVRPPAFTFLDVLNE